MPRAPAGHRAPDRLGLEAQHGERRRPWPVVQRTAALPQSASKQRRVGVGDHHDRRRTPRSAACGCATRHGRCPAAGPGSPRRPRPAAPCEHGRRPAEEWAPATTTIRCAVQGLPPHRWRGPAGCGRRGLCSTLGVGERMRVPCPAARMATARGGSAGWVGSGKRGSLDGARVAPLVSPGDLAQSRRDLSTAESARHQHA